MVRKSAVTINTLSMAIKSDIQGVANILFKSSYVVKFGIITQLITRHTEKLTNDEISKIFYYDPQRFTSKIPVKEPVSPIDIIRLNITIELTNVAFDELERITRIKFKKQIEFYDPEDESDLIDPTDPDIDYESDGDDE